MKPLVKYNNIEYFMPFLFCNDIYIPILNKLSENEINPIKYIYGSPDCAWAGGRPAIIKSISLSFFENYLKKLRLNYNVIPTLTFTNLNIKEKLNDEYSNNLLDIAYSLDCRFIVATKDLYNHIKSRYPESKMHCSVIIPSIKIIEEKDFDETKFYNKMLDKYEVVVIRPEYTMDNIDKLDKLISDISRVEILINQNCHYNCPHYRVHYNSFTESDNGNAFTLCSQFNENYRSVHLTDEQVQKAIDLGVKKLKLQGRSLLFAWLFDELYENFFNDEYPKDEIRNKVDRICAEMIQNNKETALYLNL